MKAWGAWKSSLAPALGGVREDQEVGTDWSHWDHFQRDRSIPAWTLQCLAPCVRCTDSCSWSPPKFIWELKASPEQPALSQEGSLHVGYPGRASALRVPCNQRHLCPDAFLSLQTPASLQALEELPYHLSAVSGTSAPGKNICSWESGRPEGCREPGPCPSSLPCPAASAAPGAWAWGGAG